MEQSLVLVESEMKAQALQSQYEGVIKTVVIRTQPVRAIIAAAKEHEKSGQPALVFEVLPAEMLALQSVHEYLGGAILLAFDPDQRGEYWCWLLSEYIKRASQGNCIPKRLYLTGIGREDVKDSCRLLEPLNSEAPYAFYIHTLFGQLLSKHLQRLLGTRNGPDNLPLTYETLTTLFLLEERDSTLKSYKPGLKWQVRLRLKNSRGQEFGARLEEVYGLTDDGYFRNAEQMKEIIGRFRNHPPRLTGRTEEELVLEPPAPYRLSDLLVDALAMHGISLKKSIESLRRLYQGVQVEELWRGLVSSYVPVPGGNMMPILERIRHYVEKLHGGTVLREQNEALAFLDTVGSAVILPVFPEIEASALNDGVETEDRLIYGLIRGRALASQMVAAVIRISHFDLGAGGEFTFRGNARKIVEQGYLRDYHGFTEVDLFLPFPLDEVDRETALEVVQIIPEQTSECPPEYYTIDTLFSDLADFSIFLDSVSIHMLQNMVDAGYIHLTPQGAIQVLGNTDKVVSTMMRVYPSIPSINLSAYISQTAAEVLSHRKTLDSAMKQCDQILLMHGKGLVKVSISDRVPETLLQQRRSSRGVIKAQPRPPAVAAGGSPLDKAAAMLDAAEKRLDVKTEVIPADLEKKTLIPTDRMEEVSRAPGKAQERPTDRMEEVSRAPEMAQEQPADRPDGGSAAGAREGAEAAEASVVEAETESFPAPVEAATPVFTEAVGATTAGVGAQHTIAVPDLAATGLAAPEAVTAPIPVPGVMAAVGTTKACTECGRPMVSKDDRYGKYWSCSGFPLCRHAESFTAIDLPKMSCPLCHEGEIIQKITPTGKPFYICTSKACEFMAWSRPHAMPCPLCNSPFLVEKKDISGTISLRCPRAGCNFIELLENDQAEIPAVVADPAISHPPATGQKRLVRVRKTAASSGTAAGGVRKVRVVKRK